MWMCVLSFISSPALSSRRHCNQHTDTHTHTHARTHPLSPPPCLIARRDTHVLDCSPRRTCVCGRRDHIANDHNNIGVHSNSPSLCPRRRRRPGQGPAQPRHSSLCGRSRTPGCSGKSLSLSLSLSLVRPMRFSYADMIVYTLRESWTHWGLNPGPPAR